MENNDEIQFMQGKAEILETIETEIGFYESDSDYEDDDNENIIVSEIERRLGVTWTDEQIEFFLGATCLERLKFYREFITEYF